MFKYLNLFKKYFMELKKIISLRLLKPKSPRQPILFICCTICASKANCVFEKKFFRLNFSTTLANCNITNKRNLKKAQFSKFPTVSRALTNNIICILWGKNCEQLRDCTIDRAKRNFSQIDTRFIPRKFAKKITLNVCSYLGGCAILSLHQAPSTQLSHNGTLIALDQ